MAILSTITIRTFAMVLIGAASVGCGISGLSNWSKESLFIPPNASESVCNAVLSTCLGLSFEDRRGIITVHSVIDSTKDATRYMRPGDIIKTVNRKPPCSLNDIVAEIRGRPGMLFLVERGSDRRYVVARITELCMQDAQDILDGQSGERVHVVKKGEALSRIARHYGTSVEALRIANGLEDLTVRVGQRLRVPLTNNDLLPKKEPVNQVMLSLPQVNSPNEPKGIRLVSVKDSNGQTMNLYERSYALLVGVSKYTAGWPSLPSIPDELASIDAALQTNGFATTKVMNPDSAQLKKTFEDFIAAYGYRRSNRLLFFYSGHGWSRKGGEHGYLVPTDAPDPRTDEEGFLRHSLSMTRIMAWCKEMDVKHVLFLFDSCFSGTIFKTKALPETPPHITALTTRPVRQFISAGDAGEEVPARSVFAACFLRGLSGEADLSKDGYVTGTELGMYLHDKVVYYRTGQTPQYGKMRDPEFDAGDFVFEVSPLAPFPRQDQEVIRGSPLSDDTSAVAIVSKTQVGTKGWYVIQGELQHPGRYEVSRGLTLTAAITKAGGLGRYSNGRKVKLTSTSGTIVVNVEEVVPGGPDDPLILNGDTVTVPVLRFTLF